MYYVHVLSPRRALFIWVDKVRASDVKVRPEGVHLFEPQHRQSLRTKILESSLDCAGAKKGKISDVGGVIFL